MPIILTAKQKQDFITKASKYSQIGGYKRLCCDIQITPNITYSKNGIKKWPKNKFVHKKQILPRAKLGAKKQQRLIKTCQNLKDDEVIFLAGRAHLNFQTQAIHGWIKKINKKHLKQLINNSERIIKEALAELMLLPNPATSAESGNGNIDGMDGLFGNDTTQGFAELSAFDSNKDNVIDQNYNQFGLLKIWHDANATLGRGFNFNVEVITQPFSRGYGQLQSWQGKYACFWF